ncbi:MAG: protease family protein [Verrucomicrobiota bacterium]
MNAGSPAPPRSSEVPVHLRGHLLIFDRKPAPQHDATSGLRLLCLVVLLEVFRLGLVKWLYPVVPLLVLIPLILVCALLSIRFIAGLKFSQIGFRPWHEWTAAEKSYFFQLLVIANVVFSVLFATRLQRILAQPSALRIVATGFVPYLFFGFYQEVVYRGMVQSELVRRWGVFLGILTSNILYTFGPLHWYYFSSRVSLALPMFASIFAIGLFFGVLFRRSGNLWMVGVIHGIGNAYIVGSLGPIR